MKNAQGTCTVCGVVYRTRRGGAMVVHGPPGGRCAGVDRLSVEMAAQVEADAAAGDGVLPSVPVGLRLMAVGYAYAARLRHAFGPVAPDGAVTVARWLFLRAVGGASCSSLADVAYAMRTTPQSAHSVSVGLVGLGWVDCSPAPAGVGRVVYVVLTAEGRRVLDAANAAAGAVDGRLGGALGFHGEHVLGGMLALVEAAFVSDGASS